MSQRVIVVCQNTRDNIGTSDVKLVLIFLSIMTMIDNILYYFVKNIIKIKYNNIDKMRHSSSKGNINYI